jgi:hypothetical protein
VPNNVARLEVSGPATARTGDVVRFSARALDANGSAVADAPVRWTVNGEAADVYPDGGFVAEKPGAYIVSALVGNRSASGTITVSPRVQTRKLERVNAHVFSDGRHRCGQALATRSVP